jgi:hypothetical protein
VRPKTKERKRLEGTLIYSLELYSELRWREGVEQTLFFLSYEIDKIVETLKERI